MSAEPRAELRARLWWAESSYDMHFAVCRARPRGMTCQKCLDLDAEIDHVLQEMADAACALEAAR